MSTATTAVATGSADTAVYGVTGISCGHCSAAVTEALSALPGVTGVEIDLPGQRALVTSAAPLGDLGGAGRRRGRRVPAGLSGLRARPAGHSQRIGLLDWRSGSVPQPVRPDYAAAMTAPHLHTQRLELDDQTLREWNADRPEVRRRGHRPGPLRLLPRRRRTAAGPGVLLWGGVRTRIVGVRKGDDLALIPAEATRCRRPGPPSAERSRTTGAPG